MAKSLRDLANQAYKTTLAFFQQVDNRESFEYTPELSEDAKQAIRASRPFSMTSDARMVANYKACRYVIENNIDGDWVECGVWKGGNGILAKKLIDLEANSTRRVYLFDTYAGMTSPTDFDRKTVSGISAKAKFNELRREDRVDWCYSPLDEVKQNFLAAGTSLEGVRFVVGDVLSTLLIEANLPKLISVLRLDTDWYESTLLELEVLYDRVSPGGVIIVDDYGD